MNILTSREPDSCNGGKINLWESRTTEDPLITKSIYASVDNRNWPEDVAFFKDGESIVAVYKTADIDQQIAIINMNPQNEENEVVFVTHDLEDASGINRVICPKDDYFIIANQNRSVYVWDIENLTPTLCHKKVHSNNISDICELKHKSIVISVGLDKNVYGYDYEKKEKDIEVTLKSPCLAIEPNPVNKNLLVIQTKSDDNQLVLLDYRKKKSICEFGWTTEVKTKSQVVSPSWSPSGWLVSTGSTDSDIKIFDIRILREDPAQIIRNVHKNKVIKAAFHPLQPVLVSISSDHLLGFHVIKT